MSRSPIAVCGMGLRLPGGIEDPETLWDYLVNKRDARSHIPKDRFDSDGYYSAEQPKSGTIKMRHGYFLSGDDIQQFDAASFSMTRREVERTDPQQRLLLEVVREALESAGESSWKGSKIGCYVGTFGQDWLELQNTDKSASGQYNMTGQGDFMLSNRVSFEYDFTGPR